MRDYDLYIRLVRICDYCSFSNSANPSKVTVNSKQGSDVGRNAGRSSSDQRPFIVVAAASSSSENDADPNEAFIPTNDDNDANRPSFKLLTQEDLQRHSVLPTQKLPLPLSSI